jgi:hypothetical protein
MGGSAEEVSGAVGLAASAAAGLASSAAVDLVVSADSVGASDVSAVVDSDVVLDSTVGMVGVITPTTTDAIIRVWTHDMAEELEALADGRIPLPEPERVPWDVLIAQAVNWDILERLAA